MEPREYILNMIEKARVAQQEFETYSQEKVDEAVRAIGKVIADAEHARELARMAVDETGMGNYEDKILKNEGKARVVWHRLKGVKSRGIIKYYDEKGLVDIAKPIGVIGAVTPVTNPVITPNHNAMIALKGGNAMIVSPHPRAKMTSAKTVEYMRDALKEVGAPVDLIQVVEEPTIELSGLVMKLCDATISTGGPGMVKAAYSSGKPAFGVGPGNLQCLLDTDIDLKDAVAKLVRGRTLDNGILCVCEQTAICSEELYDDMIKELISLGGHLVEEPTKIESLRNTIFPDGALNKDVVGAPAVKIAKLAGFDVPEDTKFMFVPIDKTADEGEVLAREKLCVVLSIYKYKGFKNGADIAYRNVKFEGTGHSMIVHSNNKENIEYLAKLMPVSRIGVNMIGASGVGGRFDNGYNPTATLGCGTWGNNSISENLWWNHLVNTSKIGYELKDAKIPTDEELWG